MLGIAAIASDNPLILEQNEISQKINRLEALASSHIKEVQEAKRKVVELPQTIGRFETIRDNLKADISARQDSGGDKFRAMKDVPYKALAVIESADENGIIFREDD